MDMHFEGVIFHTHANELARRLGYQYPSFAVLDVRSEGAFARSRVPGSIRVAPGDLSAFPASTDAATEFFIVGQDPTDGVVRQAAHALKKLGARRVVEVTGGFFEWARQGLPIERGRSAA